MKKIDVNALKYYFLRGKVKVWIMLLFMFLMTLGLCLWGRIKEMRGDTNYST
ncbi:MAG: hypothetical protein ACFE91_15735 [Promethearchaeota archaeon]